MNYLLTVFLVLINLGAHAHDEGHGPALKDESFYGGKIAAVIKKSEINAGRHAKLIYKAELVHESHNPEIKLYLFSSDMKPLKLKNFSQKVKAVQIEKSKEKEFFLTVDKSGKFFKGKRPLNKRVPFNIDVFLTQGEKVFFAAFDSLD